MAPAPHQASIRRTAIICASVVVAMVGLAYASVPLYRIFCQITGYGGTTQRAEMAPGATGDRIITVRFDANKDHDLPWTFKPAQRAVDVAVGEEKIIHYLAANPTDQAGTGTATFNVTPLKAGAYFNKIECFCFTEQELKPDESVEMPVVFFIDPGISKNPHLDDITEITLSYTFFRADGGDGGGQSSSLAPENRLEAGKFVASADLTDDLAAPTQTD